MLDTCEEGDACREEVDAWIQGEIMETWEDLAESFRLQLESTTRVTTEIVEEGWDKMVQCELDLPCCTYDETVQFNTKLRIFYNREVHYTEYESWYELELRRWGLEEECPDVVFYETCAELGPCWDGGDRFEDDDCSCPAYEQPDCPVIECPEGKELELVDCICEPFVETGLEIIEQPIIDEPVVFEEEEPVGLA